MIVFWPKKMLIIAKSFLHASYVSLLSSKKQDYITNILFFQIKNQIYIFYRFDISEAYSDIMFNV